MNSPLGCRAHHTQVLCQHSRLCSPAFIDPACYRYYLLRLRYRLPAFGIALHAFSLTPVYILLLLTPVTPGGPRRLLDSLNESYSAYFSLRFQRPCIVWKKKVQMTPVRSDALVLDCQKFIERCGTESGHPGSHPWSSYASHAFGDDSGYLTPHPGWQRFMRGANGHARYRAFLARDFSPAYEACLTAGLVHGRGRGLKRRGAGPPAGIARREDKSLNETWFTDDIRKNR